MARSAATMRASPGRWILTTTRSPVRSTARCTCPIDAAASGVRIDRRERAIEVLAQRVLQEALDDARLHRRHARVQRRERARHLGREEILARGEQLPELDVRRAEIGEQARQARPDRSAAAPPPRHAPAGAARGSRRSRGARRGARPAACESPAPGTPILRFSETSSRVKSSRSRAREFMRALLSKRPCRATVPRFS